MAYAVNALLPVVTNVWWDALPEPEEIQATARWPDVLCRTVPGPDGDRLHDVFREALRLAGDYERGGPSRAQPPPLLLAGGGTPLPPTPPPPPPGDDRVRLRDHIAAELGSTINLQACLAVSLSPLLAPPDHWRPSTLVGWVLPPPPPPALPPPPPSCCCDAGTSNPIQGPCVWRWRMSHACASTGTRRRLAGRRSADLRDPPHGGSIAGDARLGSGLEMASILGAPLESRGGRGHLGGTGRGVGILVR